MLHPLFCHSCMWFICFKTQVYRTSLQEITGGRGVDVAIEALGKPVTFSQCAQSVRDGGKAVMIGLTASTAVGEVDINRLVRRQVFNLIVEVLREFSQCLIFTI